MSQTARSFIDDLLARGRHTFSRAEAESAIGSSSSAVYLALRRLEKQGRLAMPRRGFYLIVEPQHRALGALPPASWIDDLMRFHGVPYYVGLLSAAALHGAAHQQPQELQVVAGEVLRPVTVGRVRIRFFYRRNMRLAAVEKLKTPSGHVLVSTPEMTACDLVRYRGAVSIDHAATVISELAERIDPKKLVDVAKKNDELPVIQRLGYLLDHTGHHGQADGPAKFLRAPSIRTVPLEPGADGTDAERDAKWRVLVNADFEVEGMIPEDFIVEWRGRTRWAADAQVEQDLVLSRALASIFQDPELASALALRGGTALHKLHFVPARRYSEDIDLVQLRPGPFGPIFDRVRARLDSWLGDPRREPGRLVYRFDSEIAPVVRLRLKIETNTREHFTVHGTTTTPFSVESRWWQGKADITTFRLEELLGTKLRALYQRKKGRDLFDLCVALDAGVDPASIVKVFRAYTEAEGLNITRAVFEENLATKMRLPAFAGDVPMLLSPGAEFDVAAGMERVAREVIPLLPGEPWKDPAQRRGRS